MSYEFKTVIGDDLEVNVIFDFQPFEPAEYPRDENGYPGCPASIENITVEVKSGHFTGRDITGDLSERCMERIENECWLHLDEEE